MPREVQRRDHRLEPGGLLGVDLLQQVRHRHDRISRRGLQHVGHLLLAAGVEELQRHAYREQDEREDDDERYCYTGGHQPISTTVWNICGGKEMPQAFSRS